MTLLIKICGLVAALKPASRQGSAGVPSGGQAALRTKAGDITLFKSVGTVIEELAAAMLVWRGTTA
jgi:hypothetical protein